MLKSVFKKKTAHSPESQDNFQLLSELILNLLDEEDRTIKLRPSMPLDEIGLDSIKFMQLLLSLEDIVEKDIDEIVEEIDIATIQTVQDIINVLDRLN